MQVFQNLIASEPPDASVIIAFKNTENDELYDSSFKNKLLHEVFGDSIMYVT